MESRLTGGKRAIEPLIDVLKRIAPLKDEDSAVFGKLPGQAQSLRRSVVKTLDALVKIGPPAVEPLIGVLKDENACMRSFAAEALGELGDNHPGDAWRKRPGCPELIYAQWWVQPEGLASIGA